MKFIVYYKLQNSVEENSMEIDATGANEALRKVVNEVKDLREVSVVEKDRKHSKGRGEICKVVQ